MATARDLIDDALVEIGALAAGEAASAEDSSYGLRALNRLVDQWSGERLQIPIITRTVFDLESGVQGYTFASSNTATQTVDDGFEGEWVDSLPPDWSIDGDRSAIQEQIVQVAGGAKAVGITSNPTAGSPILYRDFPANPNQRGSLSFFLRSNVGGASVVRLRNLATGNYLDSTGAWQSSPVAALTDTGVPYTLFSVSFTVESEADPRLRVEMTTAISLSLALFDDMQFNLFGGGAILIPRPVYLNHVAYVDTTQDPLTEYPLIALTEDGWASVRAKAMTATLPTSYYYNPTYPEGSLNFWPIPTSSTLRGVIYVPTQVTEFDSLSTEIVLPPGYERMLVKNLALELCPSYEKQPHPALVKQAQDSVASVKRVNGRLSFLSFDGGALIGAGGRVYDIRTGQ